MNKILLLAGIATGLLATNANAMDFTPYMSLKGAFVKLQNKANIDSDYSYSGVTHHYNKVSDRKHKDDVFGLRLAAGASTPVVYGKLRGELEFGWSDKAKNSHDFLFVVVNPYTHHYALETSVYTGMFNVYYDIDTNTKFTPYVGAGLGYAHVKAKSLVTGLNGALNVSSNSSDNNFAWNIGAGASYEITENIALDAGYRYTNYGKVKDSGSWNVPGLGKPIYVGGRYKVDSHEFLLGVRYTF